jgi:uncharacterized protein YjgD (DUF1641 family)
MAQPIGLKLPPRDPRAELQSRLDNAPAEHAEALLDAYQLVQELHDKGVFQLLRGVLGASDKFVETAVQTAQSEESINALRNTIILTKMLGAINPEVLECVAVAAAQTLGSHEKPVIEPPGLFSLLSEFRHKELRRSVAFINRFLEALGNRLGARGTSQTKG